MTKRPPTSSQHAEYDRKPRRPPPYGERKLLEQFPDIPYLKFGKIIGHGNFSHVYEGTYHDKINVAIKVIERGSERMLETEIELLEDLKGAPHIVQLYEVLSEPQTMLVFENVQNIDRDDFYSDLTLESLRFILQCLFKALEAAHERDIVHRDVKLGNILITPDFSNVVLIDWGCGTYISNSMSAKAGSRSCRPPEMLLGYRNYGCKCDIWAMGILILSLLSDGVLPWKARNSNKSLQVMAEYFGGKNLYEITKRLDLEQEDLPFEIGDPKYTLESCFSDDFDDLFDPDLIDLMKCCLNLDLNKRPTASEALKHKFFHDQ
ncbi:CAMK family protein kinase [Tritrichomonas foetus]|uniref:non-specific serine/threonine protein kinase n=1 Tax=Tritrichomonas foetus TaxID=1144522 RepID=A0A1J4JL82_9EUKA|nr:CAMK family protein kinase [Tritrichomonas foetus]|eukprot:OHS99854.1 CAMK family protein kinase [Tritrichomonas foetus]